MTEGQTLTVCNKLLLAAFQLHQQGHRKFTAEDLVVAAWRRFPNTFGLKGHNDESGAPRYPDSNRVFAEIMGSKPIRKRGFLVKVGRKVYELTETGQEMGRHLQSAAGTAEQQDKKDAKPSVSREVMTELKHLVESRAFQKVDNGELEALTFHDACMFWGITPQSSAIDLEGRHADIEGIIETARRALGGGGARFQHGGEALPSGTVALISKTHKTMQDRFQAEIGTILKRRDQRKP